MWIMKGMNPAVLLEWVTVFGNVTILPCLHPAVFFYFFGADSRRGNFQA